MCSKVIFLILLDSIILGQRIYLRDVEFYFYFYFYFYIHPNQTVVFSADLLHGVFILTRHQMWWEVLPLKSVTWLMCPWSLWVPDMWANSTMSFPKKPGGKALDALQNLPRITLANLRPEPGSKKAASWTSLSVQNETLADGSLAACRTTVIC